MRKLGFIKSTKYKVINIIVGNITKRGFFRHLTNKQTILIEYFFTFGRLPNLVNPTKFSEKMEWVKLNAGLHKYWYLVDKFEVRKFVQQKIGKKYLVPIYGVWESFEDINFEKLPPQFVLKATHGSGYVYVCKDKTKIDKDQLREKVNRWLSESFYEIHREPQYKNIKPRIIAEKYLEDGSGGLTDYKIQCFNGKPYLIEIHMDRYTNHRTVFMDLKWKRLPMRVDFEPIEPPRKIEKPENLREMISVSKKLAQKFPFVRIDLYSVKNKTYFGEITFVPNNGLLVFDPANIDDQLGRLINLSTY